MTLQLAYNTSDAPVTVDSAGFQIGGRSWGPVESTDSLAKAELDASVLRLVDEDKARASDRPEVVEALAALDRRREVASAAQGATKEQLAEALPDKVVDALEVGADGQPAKSDLVDAAIATDTVPEASGKTAKKTATSRSAAK